MKNQSCKPRILTRNCIFAGVLFSLWSVTAPSHAQTTWDGGGNGVNWLDAANWVGDDAPDSSGEDVLLDGNISVTLDPPNGTILDIGSLTIENGSTLTNRFDSGTLNLTGGLSNKGIFSHIVSASSNSRTAYVNVAGTNQIFNTSTGSISITNPNSGRNRINVIMTLDAQNQNDGSISVIGPETSADRDTARFRLENSGTFTNNGTILVQAISPYIGNNGVSYAQLQLLTNSSAVTLAGTGSVTLDVGTQTLSTSARIIGNSSSTPSTLTNGTNHTIDGAGQIGLSLDLINDGLVHATGDTAALDINPTGSVSNNASGRFVSSGIAGMIIGGGGDTFTNDGLVEARTGSSITIGADTVTLNGTIAGGGSYTADSLTLSETASLEAGDLSNADGTGSSTVGSLDFVGDLVLANSTTMNFQLGSNGTAGLDFDTVAVSGALTLDGILNVEDLSGFGAGSYRLFTFNPGNLTDNGVALGSTPGAYTYSLDADNAGGFVDLTVIPEPSTFTMLVICGLGFLGFRRRKT